MAVRRLKGIERIEGDAGDRTITLAIDSARLNVEQVQKALEDIGYESSRLV